MSPTGKDKEVEKGRVQQEANTERRRALIDSDDVALSLHNNTWAAKQRSRTAAAYQKLQQHLNEYEKGVSHDKIRTFNPSKYLSMCEQNVSVKELYPMSKEGEKNDDSHIHHMSRLLDTLRGLKRGKAPGKEYFEYPLEHGAQAIDKCVTLAQELPCLDVTRHAQVPDAMMMLMSELMDYPHVSEGIATLEEQIRRYAFEVDECAEQQETATLEGDMRTAETMYYQKITLQEAMVEVFNKIFAAIDEYEAEHQKNPIQRVHQVHQRANDDISALLEKQEDLKTRVERDLNKLELHYERMMGTGGSAQRQLQTFLVDNSRQLSDNLKAQDECFAIIEAQEKKLQQLAVSRSEMVRVRLAAIEQESRRKADESLFNAFYKQHKTLLQHTLNVSDVGEEIVDTIDEFVCNGCNSIEGRLRAIAEEVEAQRTKQHEERLKHFRALYLTIGDLAYKKERNMEELEKKIEHTHIQQELAMDTFNPKAKEFSQMKKDLVNVRDGINNQVQTLQDKSQLHIEMFKPSERYLIEAGKQFEHPAEELERINRTRQQKLIEYHNLMAAEEEGEITSPKLSEELQGELAEIERARLSIPRKPHTSGSQRRSGEDGGTPGKMTSPALLQQQSTNVNRTMTAPEKKVS